MLKIGHCYNWPYDKTIYKELGEHAGRSYHVLRANKICLILRKYFVTLSSYEEYEIFLDDQVFILPCVINKLSDYRHVC